MSPFERRQALWVCYILIIFFSFDSKHSLPGTPSAYFDCNGKPFGLVEELNFIGWPAAPNNESNLKLCNLVSKCTPREGEEGSWIYSHHCCASWSRGVHYNEHVR